MRRIQTRSSFHPPARPPTHHPDLIVVFDAPPCGISITTERNEYGSRTPRGGVANFAPATRRPFGKMRIGKERSRVRRPRVALNKGSC